MNISFCNGHDKNYQRLLNNLLTPVFFDFQFWYDLNLWDDNYESYSIMHKGEIISNMCVYKARLLWNGQPYNALSVGAVATKQAYRGQGYAKTIMEHILTKYPDVPMYLYANETVTGFYPRFGFSHVYETLPVASYTVNNDTPPRKL